MNEIFLKVEMLKIRSMRDVNIIKHSLSIINYEIKREIFNQYENCNIC